MIQSGAKSASGHDYDFEIAEKGFIGTIEFCMINGKDGHIAWNGEEYSFLKEEYPSTVNPRL